MVFGGVQVSASTNGVVISHVQAGAASGQTASAMQEFVVLYNSSGHDVDVTDWCVSNNRTIPINFACIKPVSTNQSIYLTSHSYLTIVSDYFSTEHNNYQADVTFTTTNNSSGSIAAGAETLTLKDAQGGVIDSVAWSTTALSPTSGFVLQRHMGADLTSMADTDNMSADFSKVLGVVLPASGVYEAILDACVNIAGVQNNVPTGMMIDRSGNCLVDVCVNLDDLQTEIPEEYVRFSTDECVYNYVQLQITELLANAAGSDVGREFIELYNPTDRTALLVNYTLKIGDKIYTFPTELKINPGQYMAFYNNEIIFTMANTTGDAALLGDDGSIISRTDTYNNPDDDMSWALIGDAWQYTNQMTFASVNVASIIEPSADVEVDSPSECAINQYRHPVTKRCRLLVTVATVAAACKDGQYRSEESNRCRKIALAGDTLTPCKEDQYRSEETNRCRSFVSTVNQVKPCRDNQYRSEETNRCRNIASTSTPATAFAVEPIAETGKAFVGWYALGGLGVLAAGYAAWEWRREAISAIRRAISFFTQR
ncbi:MAG: hypothetical protein JWM07_441 [Candidatus Saccharibacteria bacterium]|nr:hypothetical protein [Candidatus Saccharibacteria bacterium]